VTARTSALLENLRDALFVPCRRASLGAGILEAHRRVSFRRRKMEQDGERLHRPANRAWIQIVRYHMGLECEGDWDGVINALIEHNNNRYG